MSDTTSPISISELFPGEEVDQPLDALASLSSEPSMSELQSFCECYPYTEPFILGDITDLEYIQILIQSLI